MSRATAHLGRGSRKAAITDVLAPGVELDRFADAVGRGSEEAVLEAVLIQLGLGRALQQIPRSLRLDGQDALSVFELSDDIGMDGGVADVEVDALVRIESPVLDERVVCIGEEAQNGMLSRKRRRLEKRTNTLNDDRLIHGAYTGALEEGRELHVRWEAEAGDDQPLFGSVLVLAKRRAPVLGDG